METTSHLIRDRITLLIGDQELTISVGQFAGLANQSLICRYGDTEVLVAATMSKEPREGIDFFPLVVNFEEKMYAAGKIPGGFIKKEGRPTDQSILTSRAIDRPIRPLFPDALRNEVQIVVLVLCADQKNPPDIPALVGTGAALCLSDIPFNGPLSAVRVAMKDNEFIANPTFQLIDESPLDILVAGSKDKVQMIECCADEVSEETILDAIKFAHEHIKAIISEVEKLRERVGKEKFVPPTPESYPENLREMVGNYLDGKYGEVVGIVSKKEREVLIDIFKKECLAEHFGADKTEWQPEELIERKIILALFEEGLKKRMRSVILSEGRRIDGREHEDIRPIWSEVGTIPRAHGSAIFTRGETQAMTVATLGAIGDKQRLDDIGVYEFKRYMHHYYAAPFCYGETGFMRGPGRREIGHGALAEKALKHMIPPEEEFPYTIRLVTEILSSNGSTSMASVCGSTLSLMDAGVPIREPVAGVALGLVTDPESENYVILSDLMGTEDFYGDMDFKVAGTKNGITAIQLDLKIDGVTYEFLQEAFERAKIGRHHILGKLLETISEPRAELSPYAPRIITIIIDPEKIGDVIGPGGKIVRSIIEQTGVEIDIEDDGKVYITSTDAEAADMAVKLITDIVKEPELDEEYEGRVVKITQFGAFVRLTPSRDGLLHVSNICEKRVNQVEDCLRVGDIVRVRIQEIDNETGKISLTRKGLEFPDGDPLIERLENAPQRDSRPRSTGGYRDRDSRGPSGPRRDGGPPRRDSGPRRDGGDRRPPPRDSRDRSR